MAELLKVEGRYAAFIDLVGEIYPPAFVALGIPLQRLLIIKVEEWPLALRVIEALLRGGATRMICVDVPKQSPPIRLSTYHRLRRCVRDMDSTLVFLSHSPIVPADRRVRLPLCE